MSFGGILKNMFPFISAAASLGGPAGVMAANMIGKAIGVDKIEPTPSGIEAAITAAQAKDPEILLKLKQVEADFQVKMQELGIESVEHLEQIAADDRANARARQIAVKDYIPGTMAISVTAGFFGLLAFLILREIPATSHDVIIAMVGTLGTAWVGIVTYYFGSSKGSSDKTSLIEKLTTPTK